MADAKAKLLVGDTNILVDLGEGQAQIKKAQEWTRHFLGQPAALTQPTRSQTSGTLATAGSGR
jgi:hypothetical protein